MPDNTELNELLGKLQHELELIQSSELAKIVQPFTEKTTELIRKIEAVDFPSRLDKIDNTVSSINQGLQNVLSRIDAFERNIDDKIKLLRNELTQTIDTKIKKTAVLDIIIIILVIVSIILHFIKL
jgi:hypothetical protein